MIRGKVNLFIYRRFSYEHKLRNEQKENSSSITKTNADAKKLDDVTHHLINVRNLRKQFGYVTDAYWLRSSRRFASKIINNRNIWRHKQQAKSGG